MFARSRLEPSGSGRRAALWAALLVIPALLIAGTLIYRAISAPTTWTLDLGIPGDGRFLSGFYQPESDGQSLFRWSGPESRLVLHGVDARPIVMRLRIGGATAQDDPSRVLIKREDLIFAHIDIAPGWRVYHVRLPAAATGTGLEAAPLELAATSYRSAANDGRRLGVALDWVQVEPIGTAPVMFGAPFWRTLFLVGLLALLAALLWWLAGLLVGARAYLRLLVVALFGAAAALVLILWARSDPHEFARALPAMPWTLLLLLAILAVGRIGKGRRLDPGDRPEQVGTATVATLLALAFLVALGLRFYRIADLPFGLWRDEARHGLVALRMLEDPGYRPAYVSSVDLPAAGLYPFALVFRLWGIHTWSMRPLTALAGALTIFPLYGLAYRLAERKSVALLAAAFLAVSSWHISISRLSWPIVFDPLLTLTGLWLLIVGLDPTWRAAGTAAIRTAGLRRATALLLSGACLGLALQTYHTGRMAPLIAALLALLLLRRQPHRWRTWLGRMLLFAAGFLVAAAPLLLYAVQHPEDFNSRVNQVFLLSEGALRGRAPLAAVDQAVGRLLLMFNVRGDPNGRHHAPGHPLLDVVTGLGFLAGCFITGRGWRRWPSFFLLAALAIGILPSALAVDAPHALRSIHALAFACILAALGWSELWRIAVRMLKRDRHSEALPRPQFAAALLLCIAFGLNFRTYFVTMPITARVWQAFYPVHTQIGAYIREQANTAGASSVANIYVPAGLAENDVLAYLTHNLPIRTFDGTNLSTPAPPEALFLLSGYIYQSDIAQLEPLLGPAPVPAVIGPAFPDNSGPSFVGYRARQ